MPGVVEQVSRLAAEVAATTGCEVVDVTYTRNGRDRVLQLSVDHPAGVDLELCTTVSNQLSALLDHHDVIPETYRLEVSSPGLTRPLRKREDYTRFNGRRVAIRTFRPPEGDAAGRKSFQGVLRGMEGNDILIEMDGETDQVRIAFDLICKANLEIDFRKERTD